MPESMGCLPHGRIEGNGRCYDSWSGQNREIKLPVRPGQHHYGNMKQKIIRLSKRYQTALGRHLKEGRQASLQPAVTLGRHAVTLGVETLELAKIHGRALATLNLPSRDNGLVRRADSFFYEANSAIEATHGEARQTQARLGKLMSTLERRTAQLAASNRKLQNGVARRKVMEDEFARRGVHHKKCLEESLDLQKRLRQLTHKVLSAQEKERKKISVELQDEIAQTLLGINVRLLNLKLEARHNTKGLRKEISSTQKLVAKSARSVRHVGRKIGKI